jgi:hypothetical protein
MFLATIIALIFFLFAPNEGPSFNPFIKAVSVLETQNFKVSERFDFFDGYFELADIIIRENRDPCGLHCQDLNYRVAVQVEEGFFRLPEDVKALVKASEFEDDGTSAVTFGFEGSLQDVNQALKDLQFKPICPFADNPMKFLIITGPKENGVATGQIVSADVSDGVVVSGTKEQVILSKIVTHDYTNVHGLVQLVGKALQLVD